MQFNIKKATTTFTLLLVLSFTLVSISEIEIAKAEGTIYIRADGTVEGTEKIQQEGNVYTLTGNINGSIVVEKNNITIDGNDYTLQAGIGTGIYLFGRENVAVQDTQIKTFGYGIMLKSSSNNHINGNNIIENHGDGIFLYSSSNNSINGNNITDNGNGIVLGSYSNYNSIRENNIANNGFGINLWDSSNNSISGNNITANRYGGICTQYSSNNIIYHNNFINNSQQVNVLASGFANFWDDGAEGNYWSDYEERYTDATEIENSGIWDTPYIMDEKNKDNHPLVNVIPEFPSWIILPLLITLTFAAIFYKKRLTKTQATNRNRSY
jgi:parallel beta-helix repeat protein